MKEMRVSIRTASLEEAKEIAQLINKTWKISYKGIMPEDILQQRNYVHDIPLIEKNIKSYNTTIIVAVTDKNKIIGEVSGGVCREKDKKYDAELYTIYVLPEYQNKNVGTLLFSYFCDELKKFQFKSLMLWTLKKNKPTRQFYEKLNGKIIAEKYLTIGTKKFEIVGYGWEKLPDVK